MTTRLSHDLVLHHYPASPVAEKVRVVLGIKHAAWRSVTIPRLPPKPMLMPLTGGYRRTPVLQIGADIYCDSQCIARELERRIPEPTLYPGGGAGLPWALSRWTDDVVFPLCIGVIFGALGDELPKDFAADRGRLYFGPDFDLDSHVRDLPHQLGQLRGHLLWLEQRLAGGRPFVLGDAPGLPDALCYYLIWFVRGRYAGGPALLDDFSALCAWESRVQALGHGESTDLGEADSLAIAAAATPEAPSGVDAADPLNLAAGQGVQVAPDVDGGDPPVSGRLVTLNREEIALARNDDAAGDIVVHFPRVGYRVQPEPLP